MTSRRLVERLNGDHSCVGTGLVILDLVFDQDSRDLYIVRSGGSCGNVLAILSYLGWKTYPVARLGQDRGAEIILEDLARFGVDTRFISQEQSTTTPAIVEIIRDSSDRSRTHSYSLHCPQCGNYLLRYKSVSKEMAERVLREMCQAKVFYFDRASRGSLTLARHYRDHGALTVFEPSSIREERLFKEATRVAHILKYSFERLPDISNVSGSEGVPLEIQTLGRGGLRYRWRGRNKSESAWQYLSAYSVYNIVDEAGAGDWCTAGIIHSLGRYGSASFWRTRLKGLEKALQLGQALAAVNCSFPSARGAMHSLAPSETDVLVRELISGACTRSEPELPGDEITQELLAMICDRCSQNS